MAIYQIAAMVYHARMRARVRSLAPLFATVLLLGACDKADDKKVDKQAEKKPDDKQVEEPKPEEPKPETAAVLTLGAAKIMEKDKPEEAIEIMADGTVKMSPEPDKTVKISTDGKVTGPEGKIVAQVGADGKLSFDGKDSGIVLSDTGLTMTGPDGKTGTAKFLEDGTIAVDPAPAENLQMIAEGCTGPMVKTCALVLTLLLLTSEPGPEAAAVEVAAEPALVAEPKKP
jgi:hypothetical protein